MAGRRHVHYRSRETILVSANWVEEQLDKPSIVLVEVDDDTTRHATDHTSKRHPAQLGDDTIARPLAVAPLLAACATRAAPPSG